MSMIPFDPEDMTDQDLYFLITALAVPRPIAWVSTLDASGGRNLAPYSYFNVCSAAPPILHFTSTGTKDSVQNVEDTGEFVVNVVDESLLENMNVTAVRFTAEEDEFDFAGLEAAPSSVVGPPRVARAKVVMECRLRTILEMGQGRMVFGDVVHISVADSVWRDGRVDPALLKPVGRLAGSNYLTTSGIRYLRRPERADFA